MKLFNRKHKNIITSNVNSDNKTSFSEKAISRAEQVYQAERIVSDLLSRTGLTLQSINSSRHQIKAWNDISDLRTVVSKISNYFIRVNLVHEKLVKGEWKDISDNSNLIKLLNKPNEHQDRNSFLEQAYSYWNVTGNNFIRVEATAAGFENDYNKVKSLNNLNPVKIDFELDKSIFFNIKLKDLKYSLENNKIKSLTKSELIHIKEIDLVEDLNYNILGNSKLNSQKHALSNLVIAYEAKNVLLAKRGALGIFTNKGGEMAFPLSQPEKEKLQKEYENYGLSNEQWQVIFTNSSLIWQQIAMNSKDLQIFEGLEDDRQSLCSCYSLPYLLFKTGGGEGSTFNNLDTATKQVYREKTIPDWGTFQAAFNNFFDLAKKGERLIFDYSHIDVLQKDLGQEIDNDTKKTTVLSKLFNDYNTGNLTYEQAYTQLTLIWDFKDDKAKELLKKDNNTIIQTQTT